MTTLQKINKHQKIIQAYETIIAYKQEEIDRYTVELPELLVPLGHDMHTMKVYLRVLYLDLKDLLILRKEELEKEADALCPI